MVIAAKISRKYERGGSRCLSVLELISGQLTARWRE